ncbi:DUF4397 domain-containing protein [Solicola sp. PLA-1-18]|uniref:DUF4397 domain-containing protein n=1 Tax=Solicola sp. PLA-1-18 TaxID=3380532 RepID=UPI003B799C19
MTNHRTTRRAPARRTLALLLTALLAGGAALAAPTAAQADAPAKVATETSWVRAGHLVPGMAGVQVDLTPIDGGASGEASGSDEAPAAPDENGVKVIAGDVEYGTIGDYMQVPSGPYTVSVRTPGSSMSDTPLLSATIDAKPGAGYTIAGLGTKTEPQVKVLDDDLTPPAQGSARVRLINATADVGSLDVSVNGGGLLAQDAQRGVPTGYAEVPAGDWTLDVTAKADGQPVKSDVTVDSAAVYTLVVTGTSADKLSVSPVVDASGTATMPRKAPETGRPGTAESTSTLTPVALSLGVVAILGLGGLAAARRRATR